MMILPGSCVVTFGLMLHDRKDGKKPLFGRQGAVIFGAMAIIFLIGLAVCFSAERAGNPVVGSMDSARIWAAWRERKHVSAWNSRPFSPQ